MVVWWWAGIIMGHLTSDIRNTIKEDNGVQ